MVLTSFDPFREFDRALSRSAPVPPTIAMDAVRREHEVELRMDVPGYTPEQIDVTVEKNVVTVTAQRDTSTTTAEGEQYLARERRFGSSRRQVVLSDVLDGTNVTASLDHGVLTLVIPVADRAKPQKIAVTSGGGSAASISATSTESASN